jgi:two-component system chemotaxis response regulator CheB
VTTASAPVPRAQPARLARALICDDSVVIRGAVSRMLESDPGIRVVARAANGQQAIDALKRQPSGERIDVIVLDIEMPVMDGMTALPLLLCADPTVRVVMASTLTTRGADIAMRALSLGASDYVPKPDTTTIADDSFRTELLAKVKGLARLHQRAVLPPTPGPVAPPTLRPPPRQAPLLLAIGSSTGGLQALFTLVQGLGPRVPVLVVLTQHMPPTLTPILAAHLSRLGGMPCAEAHDGETLQAGRIVLAPGDRHLIVAAGGAGSLRAHVTSDPPENFCRPAVDPMLRSAAAACDGRVLMVMLTGMGHDGLAATRQLVMAGGTAIAQDEASSVVWGMPGAIAQAGLCHKVLPLPAIAPKVLVRGRGA